MLYITASSTEEAASIGKTLLEERLAACINIIPGMTSMYWWQGRIESSSEAVLIVKTTEILVPEVEERVLEMHSYECPCVIALPINKGNKAFLQWIDETAKASPGI